MSSSTGWISEWSTRNCFVWAVERPITSLRGRRSRDFVITNEHSAEYSYYCELILEGKTKTYVMSAFVRLNSQAQSYQLPVFAVHVENKNGRILSPLSSVVNTSKLPVYSWNSYKIWSYSEEDIVKEIPNFMTDGILIFLFVIKSNSSSFKFQISTNEKSVQTEDVQIEEKFVQTSLYLPCLESLSDNLSKLLNKDSEPDLKLKCADQVVEVHKSVLSARSKVFHEMFQKVASQGCQIEIKEVVDTEIFVHFLRYLYTGTLPDLTMGTAKHYYEIGHKYAVLGLIKRCAFFFKGNFQPENVCEILALASDHSDSDLKESAISYILENRVPLNKEVWMPFCSELPSLAIEVFNRFYAIS